MAGALKIAHALGNVVIKPAAKVDETRLRQVVKAALDDYAATDHVPAATVLRQIRDRHGDAFQSPGYYLRLYRKRADLTQAALAARLAVRQHHISEMEHNKRVIGKAMARRLAGILDCNYARFL